MYGTGVPDCRALRARRGGSGGEYRLARNRGEPCVARRLAGRIVSSHSPKRESAVNPGQLAGAARRELRPWRTVGAPGPSPACSCVFSGPYRCVVTRPMLADHWPTDKHVNSCLRELATFAERLNPTKLGRLQRRCGWRGYLDRVPCGPIPQSADERLFVREWSGSQASPPPRETAHQPLSTESRNAGARARVRFCAPCAAVVPSRQAATQAGEPSDCALRWIPS